HHQIGELASRPSGTEASWRADHQARRRAGEPTIRHGGELASRPSGTQPAQAHSSVVGCWYVNDVGGSGKGTLSPKGEAAPARSNATWERFILPSGPTSAVRASRSGRCHTTPSGSTLVSVWTGLAGRAGPGAVAGAEVGGVVIASRRKILRP